MELKNTQDILEEYQEKLEEAKEKLNRLPPGDEYAMLRVLTAMIRDKIMYIKIRYDEQGIIPTEKQYEELDDLFSKV